MSQPIWLLKIRLGLVQSLFSTYCDVARYDKAAEALAAIAELTEKIGDHQAAAEAYTRAADFHKRHGTAEEAERLYKKSRELGGAPDVMPSGLELTPEEIEAERQDQALMQAVAMMNQQSGSSMPPMEGAVQINSELQYWSFVGNVGKVKLALQNGENVNQVFDGGIAAGLTALHVAAMNNRAELTQFLLSVGADRKARTPDGQTALDLAKSKNYAEIIAILEER